jgi:Ion channel
MTQPETKNAFQQILGPSGFLNRERRSKLLLASIILFYILPALSEDRDVGKLAILLVLYVALAAAAMELAEHRALFWSCIPLAVISMVLLALGQYFPNHFVLVARGVALAAFFSLVSISLFIYLGRAREITSGGIYISVSLYFLLGMSWFAIYSVINLAQPGSFVELGQPMPQNAPWSTILYFSLTTLTTLGYGDIVAVKPAARMFATLESAAGVLYVAITVSRLVAARSQKPE